MALSVFTSSDDGLQILYAAKKTIAPALTLIVATEGLTTANYGIAHSAIEIAHILDIGLPAPNRRPEHIPDAGYNLLNTIKANCGLATIRRLDADELLFNPERPFSCPSSINERLINAAKQIEVYAQHRSANNDSHTILLNTASVLRNLDSDVVLVEKLHRAVEQAETYSGRGVA